MVKLGPFPKGMNNKQPDHALPDGTIRNGVNVDIDDMGKARMRKGCTKVYSGLALKESFECPLGIYFREGSVIKKLNADNTAETVLTGISGDRCVFEYFNSTVYLSDNVVARKVTASGSSKWGIAQPSAPVLSGTSGLLAAGTYAAALTYVDENGVESGASPIVTIALNADSGVHFQLSLSADPQVVSVRIYLGMANGNVLYHVSDVDNGTATYSETLGGHDAGKILDLEFASPPPAGELLRYFAGRMYIAAGSVIWYTDPYSLDHVQMARNFLQFPADVTAIEAVDGGLFVVADKTYFFEGRDPEEFIVHERLPYGAILGTGKKSRSSEVVYWQSKDGLIAGFADGSVKNLQEENVAAGSGDSGAVLIREQNGIRQALVSMKNPTVSNMAARSFIEAEIVRKGA